jgi:hypothetical protein
MLTLEYLLGQKDIKRIPIFDCCLKGFKGVPKVAINFK